MRVALDLVVQCVYAVMFVTGLKGDFKGGAATI